MRLEDHRKNLVWPKKVQKACLQWHKKEKPLTSLVSMGGGAAGMANAGGAAGKVYNDEWMKKQGFKLD